MDKKLTILLVLLAACLTGTVAMTVPAISSRVPGWVPVVSALGVVLVGGLTGTYASEELKKLVGNFKAWRENSPFVYSIHARTNVSESIASQQIFEKIKNILRQENISYRNMFSNANSVVIEIDDPPISIMVRVTPDSEDYDEFEDNERTNVIEIKSSAPELIRYRDRRGQRVVKILNVFYDIAKDLGAMSSRPSEVFLLINRISDMDAARQVVSPVNVIERTAGDDLQIIRAENAVQISIKNRNGISNLMKSDLAYLKPVA
ncbi:hypothetical protein GO986_01455 [Deinococcus sp. HMF7620]|uniref:Uncharacterized protein n=1 Tax=Deinococcus arboris TaxID=2682977 RepID=A0A7C9I145_9DEIO|nr:hypothetical protein [Deinococcus arboris]MVN85431.1 hypothetical protein [Deinococcus arboris]